MALIAYFIGIVLLVVVRGVTIDQFWDWFLIDPGAPFHDKLPAITTAEALGLSLVVSVFVHSETGADADREANKGRSDGEALTRTFGVACTVYALWWLFALVIKGWI